MPTDKQPKKPSQRKRTKTVASLTPDWSLEQQLWSAGAGLVAGVDEAGRGALAGPVVAAAVILPPGVQYSFRDSKTLKAAQRAQLADEIRNVAVAYAVATASCAEIDELNVLGATRLAATRAVQMLKPEATGLVTDYLKLGTGLPELAVAKGDSRSYQIAAASILAKTTRDSLMVELETEYPGYGFAGHKGYGAPNHLRALASLGACAQHRLTFKPVAMLAVK